MGDLDVESEALEVDNKEDDSDCGNEINQVWSVLSVESFGHGLKLVALSDEVVEEGNDCSLEFGVAAGGDGHGREGLPENGLSSVASDEDGDSGSKPISFLKELVKKHDENSSEEELEDNESSANETELSEGSVHTGGDVSNSLSEGDKEPSELLSLLEEFSLLFVVVVDLDDSSSCKKLKNHSRSDDRLNAQLHERAFVRGEHHSEHVERVASVSNHDSIEWDLAANQVDKEANEGPEHFISERSLGVKRG